MPIVGGLDIHRKQLTFDYLDTIAGRCGAGRSARRTARILRAWLGGGSPARGVASRWRGAPGGGTWPRSWPRPGSPRTSAEPADTAALRGRKRHAKTDKTDSRHLRVLLAEGGCRNAGSRRRTSWNAGRCSSCITTCGPSTPPGCSASTRCCSTRAPAGAGSRALRTGEGLAALRAVAAAGLSPAGQLQIAVALDMLQVLEGRTGRAAAPADRGGPAADRGQGAGRAAVRGRARPPRWHYLLAGRGGPVLLLPQGGPVRRAGHHRLVL